MLRASRSSDNLVSEEPPSLVDALVTEHDDVTGSHRWAERCDRELKDVSAVQDEVSLAIVAIPVAQVNKVEAERTLLKPPETW